MIYRDLFSPRAPTISNNDKRIHQYIFDTKTLLGRGCFSTVHPGIHITSNSKVAIKIVKLSAINNPLMKQLLDQETDIICSLNHKNIIRCYQVLRSDHHCYFVTEICEQGSLQKKLLAKKIYTQDEARPFLRDIYQGLKYLEAQGIVHRDLKLGNIFLKDGVAKIADFGFAYLARNQLRDIKIGSPLYMAPESLLQSLYGPKTDIWSFGILIFQLLHGRTPFSQCRQELDLCKSIQKQISKNDLRSDLSAQLKELIINCLQVRQQDRISVSDMQNLAFFKSNTKQNKQTPILRSITLTYTPTRSLFQSVRFQAPKKIQSNTNESFTVFRCAKNQNEMESSTDSSKSTTGQMCLLKGKIHFEECIGLIHFCRLIFRLFSRKLPLSLRAQIKALAVKILQDLQAKLKCRQILFTAKQLQEGRHSKLQQVIFEYQQKYHLFDSYPYPDLSKIHSAIQLLISDSSHLLKMGTQLHLFACFCSKLQTCIAHYQYSVFSLEIGQLASYLQWVPRPQQKNI